MPNDLRLTRRLVLVSGSALTLPLVLAGCGGNILGLGPDQEPQIYTLSPVSAAPAAGAAQVPWALAVEVRAASDAIDTRRIAITRSGTTMDYYANAVWPDNLPVLVQSALVKAFQDSGRIAAVSREQDSLRADYVLICDIRDFAAHYSDANGAPQIAIAIQAQMAAANGRKVLNSLAANNNVPASANSVDAAIAAFDAALGATLNQIVTWALGLTLPATPPDGKR
jgi:cholesterol transport system auxiliary component